MNSMTSNIRNFAVASMLALGASIPGVASAAVSVNWQSPADGASFQVGTKVTPVGRASATGVVGQGLDVSLVGDSSGSMGATETATDSAGNTVTKTRGAWQKEGMQSLVDGLPDNATVSIVEFDSNANTVIGQTVLDAAGRAAVATAINSINESGGTFIGSGIQEAEGELVPGTPGFDQVMVVFSDGSTSGNPSIDAANAVTAGVESVNAVTLPGAVFSTMQGIADSGNGTNVDARNDIGLVNSLLSGGGGGQPVGIASIDVTDPDGNVIPTTAGVGGIFQAPMYHLNLGANIWTVKVTGTDGSMATDTLTVFGVNTTAPIPLPAGGALLLSALVSGIGLKRLRRQS